MSTGDVTFADLVRGWQRDRDAYAARVAVLRVLNELEDEMSQLPTFGAPVGDDRYERAVDRNAVLQLLAMKADEAANP
jgi:hypothetical protein